MRDIFEIFKYPRATRADARSIRQHSHAFERLGEIVASVQHRNEVVTRLQSTLGEIASLVPDTPPENARITGEVAVDQPMPPIEAA